MNGVGGGGRDVWRGENKKGLEATSSGDCCGKENWKVWGRKRSEHANPVARQKGDTFVQLASNWKMNPPTLLTIVVIWAMGGIAILMLNLHFMKPLVLLLIGLTFGPCIFNKSVMC